MLKLTAVAAASTTAVLWAVERAISGRVLVGREGRTGK